MDKLSFGFQSHCDAIEQYLKENQYLYYKGKKVKVNKEAILDIYREGTFDTDFTEFLEGEAQDIMKIWAECEAEDFVNNKIPGIIEQALKDAAQESPYSFA